MKKILYIFGSVITFLLLYYTAAALVSLIFIAYFVYRGYSTSGTLLFQTILNNQSYNIVILAFSLLTAFYMIFYKLKKRKVSELIQTDAISPASIVFSILTGFSFYLVVRFYLSFFTGNEHSFYININHIYNSKGLAKDIITYIVTVLIVLPVLEEVTHRGILFGILKRRLNPGLALLVQGIVYAFMYSESYIIIYTFVLSLIAGVVYSWSKSILLPITVHLSFNAAALIINILSISKFYDIYDSTIFIVNSVLLPLSLLCLYRLSLKKKSKSYISIAKGQV